MTILIVYFSWKGHTEKGATTLASLLKAEIIRIVPARPIRIIIEGVKAGLSMKSPVQPITTDMSGVDTLIIASPVWAGKIPPYVNEYLDRIENGSGKSFYVLVEMGGRGAENAIAAVRRRLENKGMVFLSSAVTIEKDVESGEFKKTIESFASTIQKREDNKL